MSCISRQCFSTAPSRGLRQGPPARVEHATAEASDPGQFRQVGMIVGKCLDADGGVPQGQHAARGPDRAHSRCSAATTPGHAGTGPRSSSSSQRVIISNTQSYIAESSRPGRPSWPAGGGTAGGGTVSVGTADAAQAGLGAARQLYGGGGGYGGVQGGLDERSRGYGQPAADSSSHSGPNGGPLGREALCRPEGACCCAAPSSLPSSLEGWGRARPRWPSRPRTAALHRRRRLRRPPHRQRRVFRRPPSRRRSRLTTARTWVASRTGPHVRRGTRRCLASRKGR